MHYFDSPEAGVSVCGKALRSDLSLSRVAQSQKDTTCRHCLRKLAKVPVGYKLTDEKIAKIQKGA